MSTAYRIADEPVPGRLAAWVVTPHLPLIAWFLGGSWIALPWFVFNAHAMGSVERKRETRLAVLSVVVSLAVAAGLTSAIHVLGGGDPASMPAALGEALGLPVRAYAYAVVVVVAVKMAFAYVIHRSQEKTFGIHQYLGGRVRNGVALVVVAALVRSMVIGWAFDTSVWLGWVVL